MILEAILITLVLIMSVYLGRHYIFTVTALYYTNSQPSYASCANDYEPKVSILIPAQDEESVIGRILQRMTELTYPTEKLEIIVIDDASTDRTNEIAAKFAKEHRNIKLVDRSAENGGKGKAAALNDGLQHASGEIVYCFDADYYPQRDIIDKLTPYFVDPQVGGVQGRVTVLNEPDTLVTRLVALERIGGYRVDQLARDDLKLIPQFGGTVGGFRRRLIEALGGWNIDTLAEDTDLTFRVYLAGCKIRYINQAECYEEAVEDWRSYWHQRYRWARGHMQCAFKHAWALVKSQNVKWREKADGFLLLNVYFVPILVGLAWILSAILCLVHPSQWITLSWVSTPIFVYSAVGNFAPFFEVGTGVYLDKRVGVYWLLPLLFLTFVLNTLICTKAFIDLCLFKVLGIRCPSWTKTLHNGGRHNYIYDV